MKIFARAKIVLNSAFCTLHSALINSPPNQNLRQGLCCCRAVGDEGGINTHKMYKNTSNIHAAYANASRKMLKK